MGTSKSTIKRNLYEWKYRVSKTMVTIKNKKARLDVARKHLKKKDSGGKKKWTHEIKSPDASPTDHDFQLLNTKLNSETHK